RLSAGNYVPEHENLALESLVGTLCAEFSQAAAQKSLALVTDLDPVRVIGDPVAISRIVRNLIDNAIKYTEAGEVRVGTGSELLGRSPLAVIRIRDTGKGIPPAEHARIFEEFYQLENPGRDRGRGVGLGLAIVQRLCELIGAKIGLQSLEGAGTTFTLTMPAAPGGADAQTDGTPDAAPVSLEGRRIYVVDDERDIRNSMRTLLGVWGAQARAADSAGAAEALFAAHGVPDLLIVDLRLGEAEHGADLADRLRERHGAFAVLIITGETHSEALSAATARYAVLQKPIAAEVLRRAIVQSLPQDGHG
ncbi:MAG TPA: ATP-binding protein, partial [Burkholderiaceae bacterium]|nr:ATP-binding protein [Burkholderiaceae bacterium]